MSTTTSDSFVELLEKSQLLSSERIEEIRSSQNGSSNPKAIAQRLVKEKQLTRWQAAMLLRGRHSLRLGKYRLLEPVSSGELGDVFLAEHEQMGRRVAIHVLSRDITDNSEQVEHFLADSQKVAKLDHRNIIHVYDIDKEGDRYFIVREHAEGTDLGTMLEEQDRLSGEDAAEYIHQALDALVYAHEHDVLHLGLRPSNISVDEQGTVKVRNFGMASLAKAFASSEDEHAVEKNRYAAPEQRQGGEVDQRADICSLGIIGFQLLTGQLPTASAKRTNSTLEKIFRKMMAKRPEDRFQTAADASAYLDKWLKKYRMKKTFSDSGGGQLEEPKKPAKPLPTAKSLGEGQDEFAEVGEPKKPSSEAGGEVSLFEDDLSSLEQGGAVAGDAPFINTDFNSSTPAVDDDAAAAPPARKQAEEPEDQPVAVPSDRTKSRMLLIMGIGGGIAALIIIGLLIALILVINSKDDSKRIAEKKEKPTAKSDNSKSGEDENEATDETGDNTTDGTGGENDGESIGEPADGNGGENTDSTGTTGGTADPDQVATVATPMDTGSPMDTETPMDTGNSSNPDQAASDGGKTGTEPEDGQGEKTAGEKPEDKPKPMPEPKPKPKPKPKPVDPFANLTKTFNLPPLGTSVKPVKGFAEPVEIGSVKLDKFDFLDVGLLGGEGAYRGKKMLIKRGDGGLAQRKFEIFVSPSSVADGGELMIAKIWIDDAQKLFFQWAKEAQDEVASNALRNCKIEFRTGATIHDLTFRKPAKMEPLQIDLEKGGAQSEAVVEWMPEREQIRLEVVGLSGNAPPYRFDDATGQILDLAARGGNTRVLIGEPSKELLFLRVSASTKGRDRIEVTVQPQLMLERKPIAFNRKKIDPLLAQLKAQKQFAQQQKLSMEKQKGSKQQIALAEQRINLIGQQVAALEGLTKSVEQLKGCQLSLRVFYETQDGYQIDLASAGDINPPKQNPGKNKK